MDEFKKDLEINSRSAERAGKFKLRNGDNKIVILSNPVGYTSCYELGIAYEGCGYANFGSRKYKCYILDLTDNVVKTADFSYTVSKKLLALADGARTKFEGFPMPYSINLKTTNAGDKTIETDVLADEDFIITKEVEEQLSSFSPIDKVLENLKTWQKKQMELPEMQDKLKMFLDKKAKEEQDKKDAEDAKMSVIDYGDEPNELSEIPF